MKIVVMSDSHGNRKRIDEILKRNPDAFAFLHAGDLDDDCKNYPDLYLVKGNNDYYFNLPEEVSLRFAGVGIYMTHSNHLYYERIKRLVERAKELNCQIAVYGHTHCVDDQTIDGIRVLNPGSLYYNRDRKPIGYYEIIINEETGEYTVNRIEL